MGESFASNQFLKLSLSCSGMGGGETREISLAAALLLKNFLGGRFGGISSLIGSLDSSLSSELSSFVLLSLMTGSLLGTFSKLASADDVTMLSSGSTIATDATAGV